MVMVVCVCVCILSFQLAQQHIEIYVQMTMNRTMNGPLLDTVAAQTHRHLHIDKYVHAWTW